MLLDNSRVEALKKKRAEAAAKTANNNNNTNNTPVAAPAPAPSPSGSNSRTSAPNIPSPSTATSLESLHSTPIKSDTFTKVSSPTVSLTSSNTTVSTPPAQSVSRSNITTSSPSSASSSEPKSESGIRDLLSQIRSDSIYYSLSSLKSPGPYPDGVHHSHRELYLSEDEFKLIFGSTKEEFLAFPQWKQVFYTCYLLITYYSQINFRYQRRKVLHFFK